jgi:hypothetical protein
MNGPPPQNVLKGQKHLLSDDKPDERWIVFDGPVDTMWIESMNSLRNELVFRIDRCSVYTGQINKNSYIGTFFI